MRPLSRPALAIGAGALGFLVFGLAFLVHPGLMTLSGLSALGAGGWSESRAMLGGLELGFGLWLTRAVRRPERHALALESLGLALGVILLGRLVSLALDGPPGVQTWGYVVIEGVGLALALMARSPDAGSRARPLEDLSSVP